MLLLPLCCAQTSEQPTYDYALQKERVLFSNEASAREFYGIIDRLDEGHIVSRVTPHEKGYLLG